MPTVVKVFVYGSVVESWLVFELFSSSTIALLRYVQYIHKFREILKFIHSCHCDVDTYVIFPQFINSCYYLFDFWH